MKHSFLDPFRFDRLTGRGAIILILVANSTAALFSLVAIRWTNYSTPFMGAAAAVIVCAWVGGLREATVTAVFGAVFANYFLMHPTAGWSLDWADVSRTILWLAFVLVLSYLMDRLRSSQDKARKVLGSIGEGFCVVDHDWKFVYINEPGALLIGKKKQEILKRSYWELMPEAEGAVAEQQLRRAAAEGVSLQFEMRSGLQARWLQIRACPFADGLSIFFEDISTAKEREETLRSVLDRLSRAHRAAQMGAFEWNLNTNELMWSEDMYKLHGITRRSSSLACQPNDDPARYRPT